jgi:transposase InsO family protein
MALSSRQEHEDGLIAHSDNGSQYTSYEYTERLVRASIAPSRGRTGTAWRGIGVQLAVERAFGLGGMRTLST